MDRDVKYRRIIKKMLQEIASYTPSTETVRTETIFDDHNGHYEVCFVGWDKGERIHDTLLHLDIIEEKIWIQQNGTNLSLAEELKRAGIPADNIVIGFHPPELRQYTEFAVT